MKRYIIVALFTIMSVCAYSQSRDIKSTATFEIGYSQYNQLIISNHNSINRVSFGFMGCIGVTPTIGYTGEDYTGIITNGDYPNDVIETDTSNPYCINILAGYRVVDGLFVNGIIGFQKYESWNNCYDKHHILSNNGWYHYKYDYGTKFNYGLELNYVYRWISVSVGYARWNGVFGSIGVNFAEFFKNL